MTSFQQGGIGGGNGGTGNTVGGEASKKEEFRRYLEKTNVVESLTKALVSLFEEQERPTNAIEYVRRHLAFNGPPTTSSTTTTAVSSTPQQPQNNGALENLKKENQDLKAQVAKLQKELNEIKSKGGVALGSKSVSTISAKK